MLGILLEIGSAVLTAIGIFFQRIGLKKVKKWRDVLKSHKWILGYSLFIPALLLYLLALNFERLSIIQPVGNISIIILFLLEAIFIKERVKKREIFALALFFIGILLISL